jgi:16S rRNA (uracil1498-N3)-methyltransferase
MKAPPRFAIARDALKDRVARVVGRELHHMRDVMRLAPGVAVVLLDEDGAAFAGRLSAFERDCALVEILGVSEASPKLTKLVIAPAIIKGPRMDFIVEKTAELGATELWPLRCARSVVSIPGVERLARWRRLAIAAAKQSLAQRPMEVGPAAGVGELIAKVPKETLAIVCIQGAEPLAAVIHRERPRAILIACGPEGGFDQDESNAMAAAGFVAAGLGPNRLRSETAAIAAVGVAACVLEEVALKRK